MRTPLVAILLAVSAATAARTEAAPKVSPVPQATTATVKTPTTAATLPTTMRHIVIKVVEPKMSPQSSTGQPTEYWFAGTTFMRKDHGLDKVRNKQKEIIVASPDYWQLDLVSKSGQHIHEKKAKPVELPIFSNTFRAVLGDLQFGKEVAYFQAKKEESGKAKPKSTKGDAKFSSDSTPKITVVKKETPNGTDITEYQQTFDGKVVTLDVDSKTDKPITIGMHAGKSGKGVTMQYLTYEVVPFKASVFQPAANLKVESFDGDTWRKREDETRQQLAEIESKAASYRKQLIEKFVSEHKGLLNK